MAKFKKGLDIDKTINTVIRTFEGLSNEWIEKCRVKREPIDYQKTVVDYQLRSEPGL